MPAREIGELVMNELKKLDKIAYIRFASVYRSFQDVDDFRDVLQDLEPRHQSVTTSSNSPPCR